MRDTRQEVITRGREAEELLGTDEYAGAWALASARVRDELYQRWLASKDVKDREAAWAQSKALDLIEEHLRRIKSEGEFEQEALRRAQ